MTLQGSPLSGAEAEFVAGARVVVILIRIRGIFFIQDKTNAIKRRPVIKFLLFFRRDDIVRRRQDCRKVDALSVVTPSFKRLEIELRF